MKIKERALAIFVSLVMVLTLMPALAFANDSWSAMAKDPIPRIQGGTTELEVVINNNNYGGDLTFKWYKSVGPGTGEGSMLEEDLYANKITIYTPGYYYCVIEDIDERKETVEFYVGTDDYDPGWTAQIKSISVSFVDEDNSRFQFHEGTDKTMIARWNDAIDDEDDIEGYDYGFCVGDKITATLTDGATKTVVAKDPQGFIQWYVNEDEDYLQGGYYAPSLEDDQFTTPWTPDGDNYFWVMFGGIEDEEGNLTSAESTLYKATIIPATPAEDLAAAKAAAKSELETYKNAADYRPAQQTELANAIAAGKTAIDNANDKAGVASALASAKAAIDKIKTAAQLNTEETTQVQPVQEIMDLPVVKISKPKAAKKKITVKWKKVSKKNLKKISGIQIRVATDPNFTNIVKTATVGKKKTSKVIKGLQPKTKYYVQIRAYAAGNHVSDWRSKSVKVK